MTKGITLLITLLALSLPSQAELLKCTGQFDYGTLQLTVDSTDSMAFEVSSYGLPKLVDLIEVPVTRSDLSAQSLTLEGETAIDERPLRLQVKLNRNAPEESDLNLFIADVEAHAVKLDCKRNHKEESSEEKVIFDVKKQLPVERPIVGPSLPIFS